MITEITGLNGAYLAQALLEKGYEVLGLARRTSNGGFQDGRLRWPGVLDGVRIVDKDLTDLSSAVRLMTELEPDEVYDHGAQSFVGTSWHQPILTGQVTALGVVNMLEAVQLVSQQSASTRRHLGRCTG